MSFTHARASRIASSCPKDFDFQFFVFQNEGYYASFYGFDRVLKWLFNLPERGEWNFIILIMHVVTLFRLLLRMDLDKLSIGRHVIVFGYIYDALYVLYLVAIMYNTHVRTQYQEIKFSWFRILWYIVEICTLGGYVLPYIPDSYISIPRFYICLILQTLRVPRSYKYLFNLYDYYLKGSILAALLKYLYFFAITRLFFTYVLFEAKFAGSIGFGDHPPWLTADTSMYMFIFYCTYKVFLQIRLINDTKNDFLRSIILVISMSGYIMFVGITLTAIAHVIALHIRPGEVFRLRLRLILENFTKSSLSKKLLNKLMAYYGMFWQQQKAILSAQLLDTLPPSLRNAIHTDMYFEAQQKSRVLRDMSFQFLSEVAKVMETINYMPGDMIVSRKKFKSTMLFIEYGDVEVLTAEDDDTPILRFTRGSIINPCGLAVEVGATKAHVCVRAATFCTARVLRTSDLWRVSAKYGRFNGQSFILRSSFEEHFERLKKHYVTRKQFPFKMYKSSILVTKRNLLALKEARDGDGRLLLGRADKFIEVAGCYIMRNTANTNLVDESDTICLKTTFPCIFQPSSSLLLIWQGFIALITVIITFVYPYYMAYRYTTPPVYKYFNNLIALVLILDCVVILSTGDNVEKGVPVTFAMTSSEQLKKPWFLVDLLAAVPFLYLYHPTRFIGLNQVIKVPRVFFFMQKLEDIYVFHRNTLRFIQYIFLMLITIFWVAAIKQGLFCEWYHLCILNNYTNQIFWKESKMDDEPKDDELLMSLLWSIHLVTFSDVKTIRTWIRWSTMVTEMTLMELITVERILLSGLYAATIMCTQTLVEEYTTCINSVRRLINKNELDETLQSRFIGYLKLCWHADKGYAITHQKKSIMFDLPKHVLEEIQSEQRNKTLKTLRFWKYLSDEDMKMISAKTKSFLVAPNEIVLNTGDTISEMYIIRSGYCEVFSPRTEEVVASLTSKACMGDIETILRIPVYYTVRAVTHVRMYSISKKILIRILQTPQFQGARRYCEKLPEYKSMLRRREPFLEYEPPAPAKSRQVFPLLRKHEPDIAFQAPFQRLGFFSILRYVFPRFTIRPDGPYLRRYEWFRAGCAFLSSLIFPTYCWLYHQFPSLFYIAWMLDITAFYDLFQRLLIGYYDEKGILVYHPASTAVHYIKTAFLLDLLACVPFENLDNMRLQLHHIGNAYLQPNLYSFLMSNRVLQLYRTVKTLDSLRDYIHREDVVLIIKLMPVYLAAVSVHVIYLIENSADIYRKYGNYEGNVWLIRLEERKTIHGHWIELYNSKILRYNISESPFNLVLTAYYWLLYEVSGTNVGSFYPTSQQLIIVLISAIFIVGLIINYVAMRIISIRSNVDKALAWFQEYVKEIKTFMVREHFSEEIQEEVLSYFAYRWDMMGGTDYRTMFKLCDHITLRTDAILQIYGPTFMMCPVLRGCEKSLLRQLGRGVFSEYFKEGMTIVEHSDVIVELYIIEFGSVEVFEIKKGDDYPITNLMRGSIFGNIANKKQALVTNRFVASADVHVLVIHTDIFYKIVSDFPKIMTLLTKYRPHDENYIIGNIAGTSKLSFNWTSRAFNSAITAVSSTGYWKYLRLLSLDSKVGLVYLIIVSLASVLCTVYNATFVHTDYISLGVLYGLDFLFLLKVVLAYVVTYLSEKHSEKSEETKKRKQWKDFKYDIISCLPIEAFALLKSDDPWNLFCLLRLNRVFRMGTMQKCLKKYRQQLSINLVVTTAVTVLIWFIIMIHITSCLWYTLGILEDAKTPYSSWRYPIGQKKVFCGIQEYFCSVYYVLTTFIRQGIRDIGVKTQLEVGFATFLMLIASMTYMIFIGEFATVLQFQSLRVMDYYSKKMECETFMKKQNVAPALVDEVRKYSLYLWRLQGGIQMPHFIDKAPKFLRDKIMATAYLSHFLTHEIFVDCEDAFLRQLVGCLRVYTYMEGMYVVKEGEVTDAMYFIHKGSVKEEAEEECPDEELRNFPAGNHFGTLNGLNLNTPYAYSYKTMAKAVILHLDFNDWEFLLEHFPATKDIIYEQRQLDKDFDTGTRQVVKGNIFSKAKVFLKSGSQKEDSKKYPGDSFRRTTRKSNFYSPANQQFEGEKHTIFEGIPSGRDSDDWSTLQNKGPLTSVEKTAQPTLSNRHSADASGDNKVKEVQVPAPSRDRRKSTVLGVESLSKRFLSTTSVTSVKNDDDTAVKQAQRPAETEITSIDYTKLGSEKDQSATDKGEIIKHDKSFDVTETPTLRLSEVSLEKDDKIGGGQSLIEVAAPKNPKDRLQSMLSFIGDTALKDGGIENVPSPDIEKDVGSSAHSGVSSYSMNASNFSMGLSDSMWSVEGFMMKGKGGDTKKSTRVESVTSNISDYSVRSDTKSIVSEASVMSEQEQDIEAAKAQKKRGKRSLIWKEEDIKTKATNTNMSQWLQGAMHFAMLDEKDLNIPPSGSKQPGK